MALKLSGLFRYRQIKNSQVQIQIGKLANTSHLSGPNLRIQLISCDHKLSEQGFLYRFAYDIIAEFYLEPLQPFASYKQIIERVPLLQKPTRGRVSLLLEAQDGDKWTLMDYRNFPTKEEKHNKVSMKSEGLAMIIQLLKRESIISPEQPLALKQTK